jgi:hypothetical protein
LIKTSYVIQYSRKKLIEGYEKRDKERKKRGFGFSV